jgi:hypothetical protein
VNWFGLHPYWGNGNNLEWILLISPVADLSDSVSHLSDVGMQASNPSGCRNDSALHGGWDTHSSALGYQTQQWAMVTIILVVVVRSLVMLPWEG